MNSFVPALFASGCLLFSGAPLSRVVAAVVTDPPLATGPDAIDPTTGPMAGRQNITVRAPTAATKDALLATPGFAVVQSFAGLEGALKSPVNRIDFSDGRPSITLTINANTGYGGCASGPGVKGAFTSGAAEPKEGEAIYIGDNVNDTAYVIEFSRPVAAASFTVARTLASAGAGPNWAASFYAADGTLIERQLASPSAAPNVAALFGRVAGEGPPIARVVFGRDQAATPFVMGSGAVFIDDIGFAPARGSVATIRPAGASAARGGVARPALARTMGGAGGETIDVPAPGASPQSFLERIEGFGVVQNWAGFKGLERGAREVANVLDFEQGLDFRFHLVTKADGAEGAGGVTMEDALTVSPREALRVGGGGGERSLEITAGAYDAGTGAFIADGAVYAAGFVVTNLGSGEVKATFLNRAGEVLATQTATGLEDPANAGYPSARRGAEFYFGFIAGSPNDESRWVHRIRIESRGEAQWGLDDFGFASAP